MFSTARDSRRRRRRRRGAGRTSKPAIATRVVAYAAALEPMAVRLIARRSLFAAMRRSLDVGERSDGAMNYLGCLEPTERRSRFALVSYRARARFFCVAFWGFLSAAWLEHPARPLVDLDQPCVAKSAMPFRHVETRWSRRIPVDGGPSATDKRGRRDERASSAGLEHAARLFCRSAAPTRWRRGRDAPRVSISRPPPHRTRPIAR